MRMFLAVLLIIVLWLIYNALVPLGIAWVLLKIFPSITWSLMQLTVTIALIRILFTFVRGNK